MNNANVIYVNFAEKAKVKKLKATIIEHTNWLNMYYPYFRYGRDTNFHVEQMILDVYSMMLDVQKIEPDYTGPFKSEEEVS